MLSVAISELGYTATAGGYSKYGDWAGNAYGEWCTEFVTWCVSRADELYGTSMLGLDYPNQKSCEGSSTWFKEQGRYITVNGGLKGEEGQFYLSDGVSVADRPYVPQPGDFIYFEWYAYNRLDHVGIVEYVTQDVDGSYTVHTIEGNNHILGPTPSVVARYSYALDDPSIRGYGTLQEGLVAPSSRAALRAKRSSPSKSRSRSWATITATAPESLAKPRKRPPRPTRRQRG